MKLYAWQPRGHGPLSFFVLAESEETARAAVAQKIQDNDDLEFDTKAWPEGYELSIFAAGEVATNYND